MDGKRHGRGEQVFANNDRFEGRWQNGLQHGTGKYVFADDGSTYEGSWSHGAYDGLGTLTRKDGSKEKLRYLKGILQSRERDGADGETRAGMHDPVKYGSAEPS